MVPSNAMHLGLQIEWKVIKSSDNHENDALPRLPTHADDDGEGHNKLWLPQQLTIFTNE